MGEQIDAADIIALTAEIVGAYVAKNAVSASDLPNLIPAVYKALMALGSPPVVEAEPLKPAVSVRKSITPDFLICLEDGKKFKTLRRHLHTIYDMSPEQYREKWDLPFDYPMVAPNYSATRSALALSNGLGRKAAQPEAEAEPAPKTKRPRKVAAIRT